MCGNNAAPAATITSPTTRLFLEHAAFGVIFKHQNMNANTVSSLN